MGVKNILSPFLLRQMFSRYLGRTRQSSAYSPASRSPSCLHHPAHHHRHLHLMATAFRHPTPGFLPPPRPASKPRAMAGSCSPPSPLPDHRKLPILLFDVMDTLVRDPFYHDIPAFFNMPMKELLENKHPTAWVEFETGLIDEIELAKKFFKDGRPFDLEGLKECMFRGYTYIDGMEAILHSLKQNNYELHAFTNYPLWYTMIEEKLMLSKYLCWTFCSCIIGKRKPAPDSYMEVVRRLGVEPASCVFVDDRMANVEAAMNAGMVGLHFKNVDSLKQELSTMGVELVARDH